MVEEVQVIREIISVGRRYSPFEHFRVAMLLFYDRLNLYPHDS